jgi:DNA helicase II / ATP-dependent DNA helicase PcrA
MSKGKFKPSKYQQAIFNTYKKTNKNIVIQAGPGCGKSSTLIELSKIANERSVMLAFNKSIVEDLKGKLGANTSALTLHSLGMTSLIKRFGQLKVNAKKTNRFVAKNLSEGGRWEYVDRENQGILYRNIPRLVDAYRVNLCTSVEELKTNCDTMGVDYEKEHLGMAIEVIEQLEKYNKSPKEIDFTDMIYLPSHDDKCILPNYDLVYLDEIQDFSKLQSKLIDKLVGSKRFIAVGDFKQAIYGFIGASTSSMQMMANKFNTVELPLSICYRCPTKVIAHANKVWPGTESPEWQAEGVVKVGDYMEARNEDIIICRNVKPLIVAYFDLIQAGIKCYVKGVDIGESIIAVIKPYIKDDMDTMMFKLSDKLAKLEGEMIESGIQNPRKHPKYGALLEKIQIVKRLSIPYSTPNEMINRLTDIFKDEGSGVGLMTIHKSKGLEADNVFFLDSNLIPSKYASNEEMLIQEKNLRFVAITRARRSLIYAYTS